ncbi:unnamed protein product [Callosobruchus maculatus]|uniref:Uncharacterized protein n=1 Tax=Callosobruchus maculatus TaxID=64391 RepID=A0A653CSZ6_CALMS|nr:unnamed protein product [Callosobruchus maculatus]
MELFIIIFSYVFLINCYIYSYFSTYSASALSGLNVQCLLQVLLLSYYDPYYV